MSCLSSQNPNDQRGESHWIRYNLGTKYPLGYVHIWNQNHPDELENGAKNIVIDISNNGQDWTEVATYEMTMGNASGFYQGEEAANLNGHEARYVLITVLDNHGGDCHSIAEVRFGLSNVPDPCSFFEMDIANDPIYDGTYHLANEINSNGLVNETGDVIFKAGDAITLSIGFEVLPGGEFLAELEDCIE